MEQITIADSAHLDAFSRLRVSEPSYVFDAQLTYDLQPVQFDQVVSGSGASVVYDATNRCALMSFSNTDVGGKAYMQTFEYFRYQAGRSQVAFITFNMVSGVNGVVKFAGYSDGVNGIEFQVVGDTKRMVIYSGTGSGDEIVNQDDWNIDRLNGQGASGIVLDISKTQILIMDLQALYVGRVRVGFDIDGRIVYVHEFTHANKIAETYIQTANLPVRCGMTCSTVSSTTMRYICCSILSEGGETDLGGYNFTQEGAAVAASGVRTHILSLRPKLLFNGLSNRVKFIPEAVDVLVTGSNPVMWELCLGQAISGTTVFGDVNSSYSSIEYNILGTASGNPAIVIASGYCASTNQVKQSTGKSVANRYPLTLSALGSHRSLGTLSLLVTGLGGSSACRASVEWRELR